MRTGWLDHIFSTPNLHRFHHSRCPKEHDNNFGNITILYDRLFGTYYLPSQEPVEAIGEPDGAIPLRQELFTPFMSRKPC